MKKKTRNILLGTGVVAAGIGATVVASRAIMSKLVGIAMDRAEPEIMTKNKHRLTGSKSDVHQSEDLADAEIDLLESEYETVEIESHDGLKLVGHWQTCEAPKRVIVAMHGWRSGWARDFGVIAPFWRSNNCAVLYAEQRAQGESEGEYITFGLLERRDCLAWVNWVNERTEGMLPIYLTGVSMGATTVLMTAADDLPESVRGIVADCGFVSPYAIWRHVVGDNLHIPYTGLQSYFADRKCRSRIDMGTKDYSTLEALKESKVPVLLIHGTEDRFVPVTETYKNFEACRSPKYLFLVEGAGHGMSYIMDREGYEETVKEFWDAYDQAATDNDFEEPAAMD